MWQKLFGILGELTPLAVDCGRLCRKKCCSFSESGPGVYLFPGEEKQYAAREDWYVIKKHGPGAGYFTGDSGFMLHCTGSCPRERRPLACRLFPLAPYVDKEGSLQIILDGDALFICPLVGAGDIGLLDPTFKEGVGLVWEELINNPLLREGVKAYSARLDRQKDDPWTRLLEGRED